MTAQVVRQPYWWMRSAVTTVSPAAGPLTWRRAAEPSGDEPAHRRGDEPGLEGRAGGEGDAEGQGEGDEEHRDGGREIGARDVEAPAAGWRAVRGMGSLGVRRLGVGGKAG